MVAFQQTDIGGQHLADLIKVSVKKQHSLVISQESAQKLLHNTASALQDHKSKLLVTGQDAAQGSPKEIEITAADIHPVIARALDKYQQVLQKLLSTVPPELTVDVIDKGLLLSGGLAQLHGLEQYLTEKIGVPVAVVDQPDQTVINGIGTALEHIDLFKESLGYQLG
jgi:rod shape-determining protein MreB